MTIERRELARTGKDGSARDEGRPDREHHHDQDTTADIEISSRHDEECSPSSPTTLCAITPLRRMLVLRPENNRTRFEHGTHPWAARRFQTRGSCAHVLPVPGRSAHRGCARSVAFALRLRSSFARGTSHKQNTRYAGSL